MRRRKRLTTFRKGKLKNLELLFDPQNKAQTEKWLHGIVALYNKHESKQQTINADSQDPTEFPELHKIKYSRFFGLPFSLVAFPDQPDRLWILERDLQKSEKKENKNNEGSHGVYKRMSEIELIRINGRVSAARLTGKVQGSKIYRKKKTDTSDYAKEESTVSRQLGISTAKTFITRNKNKFFARMPDYSGTDLITHLCLIENQKMPTLTPQQAIKIMSDLFYELRKRHRQRLLHRDIKPSNIRIVWEPSDADPTQRTPHAYLIDNEFSIHLNETDATTGLPCAISDKVLGTAPMFLLVQEWFKYNIKQFTYTPIHDRFALGKTFQGLFSETRFEKGSELSRQLKNFLKKMAKGVSLEDYHSARRFGDRVMSRAQTIKNPSLDECIEEFNQLIQPYAELSCYQVTDRDPRLDPNEFQLFQSSVEITPSRL